jgi:hypothetical protein
MGLFKSRDMVAFLMISDFYSRISEIKATFSGCSMAAKAVYAESSCLTFKDIAARQAHNKFSLTNLHSFIAFSHLPFSQKSKRRVG